MLASDTCIYDPYQLATGEGTTNAAMRSSGSKIVHNEAAGLIYAVSGGSNLSREAGEILDRYVRTGGIEPDKRRAVLTELGLEAQTKFTNSRSVAGTLLVIFYDREPNMWTLDIGSAPVSRETFAFGGGGNLAMFFVARFPESRTVEELKFLAAHSVSEAHFFNPSVVDGLELWSCTNGRVERATDTELSELRKRSARFNRRVRAGLFNR